MAEAPLQTNAKQAYAEALAAMKAGQPDRAMAILSALHRANPRIPEVEWQIARLFLAGERYDRALPHAAAAAALAPAQPAVWLTFADAVALDGAAPARREFQKVLAASGLTPPQKAALAHRFGVGARGTQPAGGPQLRQTLSLMTEAFNAGRHAETIKAADGLLAAHPDCAMAHSLRGSALAALGRTDVAAKAWLAAVARAPDLVQALIGLGQSNMAAGRWAAALHWLNRAAALDPTSAEVQAVRGNALTRLRDYPAAHEAMARVVAATGRRAAMPLMMLAQAAAHLGRDAEAEATYREALALEPGNATIRGAFGVFLQGLGRFAEAEAEFLAGMETPQAPGELYRLYYASHRARADEPEVAAMQARFADPATPDTDRMALGFALAKAMEDLGEHGRVFDFLDPANALMRKARPYDIAEREHQVDQLIAAMRGMDWQGTEVPGTTDAAPIFVTGMPRSGTTLVEQIIASHSRVTGAGELADSAVSALRLLPPVAGGGLRPASLVPLAEIAHLGQDYAAMMRTRFPQTPQITDKSIQTYLTLGLVKLAMPKARIIVVRRDPRDTLLSIYKNLFPEGTHLYAYDQVDLARHYATFVKMVEFWRDATPGWFHEIQYEDLVADPETQSRALIAACGLDWEDACLNFHANDRKVETLSVFQVRQPISRKSVRAWERYGDRLAPMIGQLRRDGMIRD